MQYYINKDNQYKILKNHLDQAHLMLHDADYGDMHSGKSKTRIRLIEECMELPFPHMYLQSVASQFEQSYDNKDQYRSYVAGCFLDQMKQWGVWRKILTYLL